MKVGRADYLALLALCALPWLFFAPLFLPGEARSYFADGDFVDQFYAFASFEVSQLAAGRLPLWNPYAYSGSPFWADVQAAVAYPPSLLVALTSALVLGRLPFLALEFEAVAHFALVGCLFYLFARRAVGSGSAALIGALAFTYGGYLTGYPPLQLAVLESNAWLPAALLGAAWIVDSASKQGRPAWHGIALCSVAVGMSVLAGHPQSALYLIAVLLAFAGWSLRPRYVDRSRAVRRFAVAAALAAGLSAAGWLPALEFLRLSNRALSDYAALSHGFPPRELLGALLPGMTLWSPLYVGVLPVLLAATAVGRWARSGPGNGAHGCGAHGEPPSACDVGAAGFWLGLTGVAAALSLGAGSFVFDLFYLAVPGFDLFRGQERAAFLVSFGLAMLAAHGAAVWFEAGARQGRRPALGAAALGGCGALLAAALPPASRSPALHLAVFALATAAALELRRHQPGFRAWPVLVCALLLADLHEANARVNLQADAPGELQSTALVDLLRSADGRVHNEDRLPRNAGVLHRFEATYGASPLRLRTYEALYDGLGATDEARLWQLLAVDTVLGTRSELPAPTVAHSQTVAAGGVLHRLASPPRAWLASRVEVAADPNDALRRLAAPELDPHQTVVFLAAEGFAAGSVPPTGRQIEVVRRSPGEIELAVGAQVPGDVRGRAPDGASPDEWLVVSEPSYPGWRAVVDGQPAEIVQADLALMAVRVPPGAHRVRLWFASPWAIVGLALSLGTALLLAATVVFQRSGRRSAAPSCAGESRARV